jgi:thiol-disulfide isomerase/thioredoxin
MKKILLIVMIISINLFGANEGDKALPFNLKSLSGKSYSMNSFKGKVVLLNLWASWCSGCKKEMPEFYKLQKSMGSKFKIVAVTIDKNSADAKSFLASVNKKTHMKTPFVVLHNPSKSLARAYKAQGMPSSYLIDKKGIIRAVIVGSLNHNDIVQLKAEIKKLK